MFWTQLFMFQLNYTSIHPQHQGTEVAGSTRWGYTCIPEVQVPPSCNQENTGSGPPSQQAQRTLFPRCSCNCVEVSAAGGSLWRQRTGMKPFPDVNYLQERGVYWITVCYREDLFRIIAKKNGLCQTLTGWLIIPCPICLADWFHSFCVRVSDLKSLMTADNEAVTRPVLLICDISILDEGRKTIFER